MMLADADADVDIDDLMDDDEDENVADAPRIDDDDVRTSDEDSTPHPRTSSSLSPAPRDDVALAVDTAPADAESDASIASPGLSSPDSDFKTTPTSPSDEDDAAKRDQIDNSVLQQPQEEASNSTDDVMPAGGDTGRSADDLPEPGVTADEVDVHVDDQSRQVDVEATGDGGVIRESTECMDSLAESKPEVFHDADDNVQVTAEAPEQVCQSTDAEAVESADDIPPTSASSISEETPQTEASMDTPQEDLERPPANDDSDERNDAENAAETTGETRTELQEKISAADEQGQNDFQETLGMEMEVKTDRGPGSPTAETEDDRGTRSTEKSDETVRAETEFESGDEVTPRRDEVGREEVKDEPEVTEEVKVVEEEVKFTYEASAKQLDLLSRLAMLRERAAQRKAQEPTTDDISRDASSSGEDRELSRPTDDDAGRPDQPGSPPHHRESDDVTHAGGADVSRCADKQIVIAAGGTDTAHAAEVTGSPSPESTTTPATMSPPCRLVSRAGEGASAESSPADGGASAAATAERQHAGLSTPTADSSTAEISSESELAKRSPVNTVRGGGGGSDGVAVTSAAKDLNQHSESICAASTDVGRELPDHELPGRTIAAETSSDMGLSSADRGSGEPDLPQVLSDTVDVTAEVVLNDERSQPLQGGSKNIGASSADRTDADSELGRSSSAHRELTPGPSDANLGELAGTKISASIGLGCDEVTEEPEVTEKVKVTHEASASTHQPEDSDDTDAVNYDSDLDAEFTGADALPLLSDVRRLKSNMADGPGHLYVFADRPSGRFKIGASRSPAKRLRQAAAFNPDITLPICLPVPRRLAALRELRRRLEGNPPRDVIAACLPAASRDWFAAAGDDVIVDLVRLVAAAAAAETS